MIVIQVKLLSQYPALSELEDIAVDKPAIILLWSSTEILVSETEVCGAASNSSILLFFKSNQISCKQQNDYYKN